ncbi:MAG: tetratricopeptide repeat protein [Planctomycetota bacterium]
MNSPTFPKSPRAALALLVVLAGPACLTPAPTEVLSADEELGRTLAPVSDGVVSDRTRARVANDVRSLSMRHSNHVPTLVADAALSLDAGFVDRARTSVERALSIDPDHVEGLILAARIATEQGNLRAAEKHLVGGLRTRPNDPRLHEALAGTLYVRGDYQSALEALDVADALSGEEGPRWRTDFHRGLIAEALGDLETARAAYMASVEANPAFEPSARRLQWLETLLGPIEEPVEPVTAPPGTVSEPPATDRR